uniref:Uncharacterized protein n=1 Tax=Kalanchoe fedtschenkoi TaxID=63787 RepID=A0A7N1A6X1_KALFE
MMIDREYLRKKRVSRAATSIQRLHLKRSVVGQ